MRTIVNVRRRNALAFVACITVALGTAYASDQSVDDPSLMIYADALDITPEEVLERLELRRIAGDIDERARLETPGTYGGMEIVHLPKYHIVFRFTGNASGRLSRYTADPNFVAATVPRPIALVQSVRGQVMQMLADHGVESIASIDRAKSVIVVETENVAEARFHLRELLNTYEFIEIKERTSFPTPFRKLPRTADAP